MEAPKVPPAMHAALLTSILVLSLVLAGCADGNDGPTSTTTTSLEPSSPDRPSELAQPKVIPQVLVGSPGGGAEPNIAVAPDGTLYVASPLAIWKSSDAGKTWKQATAKGLEGGGDGDIAFDAQGNLYWLGLFGPDGRAIPFQVSTDGGESFSKAVDVSDGTGSDREWLDVTPEGHVYTTWRGESGLEFRASFDGGATWQPKVTAAPDANQGPLTHAPDGRLYFAAADFAGTTGTAEAALYVYASQDEGESWTRHDVWSLARSSPAEHNPYVTDFPVAAVDANGTVYVAWSMDMGVLPETPPSVAGQYGIFLSHSTTGGSNWSQPLLVSDPTKYARMPWMAAGGAGSVAVVWYENVRGLPGEQLPDEWNVKLWESITADAAKPVGITVTLTEEPNHLGALCTSGTGCLVSDRSLLDFFEVAIDHQGLPVVAWAASKLGTGFGFAVEGTDVYFGGIAEGTPLQ